MEYPAAGGQPTMSLGKCGKVCMECDEVVGNHNGALLLGNLPLEYQQKFGKTLSPSEFGFNKVYQLVKSFSCVLSICGEADALVLVQKERMLNPNLSSGLTMSYYFHNERPLK